MFYIGLYRENIKKSSFRKPKAKSLDIWYVASPSGHLPKIVNEYDQEIPQSQTADNSVAPRGRAAQPSRDKFVQF